MPDRIGSCRIVGEIGSGGMAVIYKAIQEPLGREVAIKALKPSIALDSQFAARFEREARFMASLQHENILHVYDFVNDGNALYIVMEYVQGIDLYDLLQTSQRLSVEIAAIIGLQVARALDYAHFRGIIHRDIKPANIIISHHGEVKLMDFGIARDHALADLTETGTGVGTPSYMSPEQILGDKLDFRSDIFSLGIVLYQMLTGAKPFVEDESRTVMQKIRLDRYVSAHKIAPEVPSSLERILARCMEKLPANRYPSTQALVEDLMEFLAARVHINHSAQLVMYLRDQNVISANEADSVLTASATRSPRTGFRDRGLLRAVVMMCSLLLVGVVLVGGVIQASAGRFTQGEQDPFESPSFSLGRAGFLRVVAEPWADVFVDGELVVTTPSAARIPLPPGTHYLKFVNPFYQEHSLTVQIRTGETNAVHVVLVPKQTAAARAP
ncbi:MAG TPA: serine/threonine-protein kinase [Polyangiales bacterium]|nr:serine/threonine-protein kinase [Polyangiales bacterium]